MRTLRMAALMLAALGLCVGGTAAAATVPAQTAATVPATAPCSGPGELPELDVTQTFGQASYKPGESITVTVTAVNCTSQTLSTHIEAYGLFTDGTGNAIAPGCIAIDPLWNPVTFAPNGTYTNSFTYPNITGCTATQFTAVDQFYAAGSSTPINSGTASVPINQTTPPVACHAVYTRQSEWQGGFTAAISITNTGQTPDNGWTLTYTFSGDQQATNVWGASATQTGQQVKLTNLPWDASIPPAATLTSVGMSGTWTTSDAGPTGFALNGVPCS